MLAVESAPQGVTSFNVYFWSLLRAPESGGVESFESDHGDACNGDGSFWHAAVCWLGTSAVGQSSSEPSSPVKLRAGLVSLAPVKISSDCVWVVGPVESVTIEVRVDTEVKSDSAGSDACDMTTPARNARQPS